MAGPRALAPSTSVAAGKASASSCQGPFQMPPASPFVAGDLAAGHDRDAIAVGEAALASRFEFAEVGDPSFLKGQADGVVDSAG